MKVIICDDNEAILTGLQKLLQKMYSNQIMIETTREPEKLLEKWKKYPGKIADILLMDIEYSCSEKNGISITAEIQKAYPNVKVIFITGKINYAQDIFEVEPSSFLLKPIDSRRLKNAIEKTRRQIENEQSENISFKYHGNTIRVPLERIQYIESLGHQINVHTSQNNMFFRMKLAECMELLPDNFWMIHQSYIVNAKYVRGMDTTTIELWDKTKLPVARSRYKEIKNKLFDQIESY